MATCGTALGDDHFRLLRNFAKRVVLAFDADGAGQSAAGRFYEWERRHEVDVVVANLPAGTDPADLARADPEAFRASVDLLPSGSIAVVQEGLLMYLDEAEKAALASNVRAALLVRGGAWVTADVYVRSALQPQRDERTARFLQEHRVEEKKFADFAAATAFFKSQGFSPARRISSEADPWPVRQTLVLEACR